jgi:endoglucanase
MMLSTAPGANPLNGADFFVNGPAHGDAAGAIARLLGYDTSTPLGSVLKSFSERESWATFAARALPRAKAKGGAIATDAALLAKIASQPEVQRVSSSSQGGGPGAIFSQTEKLFCHNFRADPGSVPIINTYFLHASLGGCPTASQIAAHMPTFRRRVDELTEAIGNRPVVLLLETDGIGSSSCMSHQGDLGDWLAALRYEVDRAAQLPHAVVYVEGGYSDANSPAYTARALRQVDISKIRGFYTNDTHINWTIHEVKWGEQVSRLLGGTHFIVNTAQNGNGPLIPHDRVKNGNEVLCNPPGRALGSQDTTDTGFADVDAFMWTSPPGNSSGSCNGGTPAGTFWAARAIDLAAHANGRLGPGYPSRPY